MQITDNKLNNASVRRKFDPLYKNILLRQNPFELVFKDISTFDGQNPIISKLLSEILIGKNNSVDKILKKVHSNHKVKIRSKLDGIRVLAINYQAESHQTMMMMTMIIMTIMVIPKL